MAHANAPAAFTAAASHASVPARLEIGGLVALCAVAAAVQFSIAAAQALFAIAIVCWAALLVVTREPIEVPRFFWPLVVFMALTLLSAALSPQPRVSLADSKQLLLFLMVPLTYRLATGNRGRTLITVILSVGAISAILGIVQYVILGYDQLGLRPRGTLGHYMTYSGLVMLVIGATVARVLFDTRERMWAALVIPALAVAVAFTSTRSAWVGVCAAVALLFCLKDFRLIALLPVVAALFFAFAPGAITQRFVSMFDLNDPTRRDRVAMLSEGINMVRDRPLFGVGPNMVEVRYAEYRDPGAIQAVNPHLHNVPLQIAAERGVPALLAWLAFIVVLVVDLARAFRRGSHRVLAAAALAAVSSMLAAGLFEHNFGDSEFLMLFLLLITLPFAAARPSKRSVRA
jgi:putative inorganic carbon (HCO3(-)) transporter